MLIILIIGADQQKNNMMVRTHIFVQGLVQGVNFRHYTKMTADNLGVTGWVKNLKDGRVEVLCEGTGEQVAKLAEWCRKGPPSAHVASTDVKPEEYAGEFKTFEVRR
jgi:acylphosphatase